MKCEECGLDFPALDLNIGTTYLLKGNDKYEGPSLREYKLVNKIDTPADIIFKFEYKGFDYGKEVVHSSWLTQKDLLKEYTIVASF